MDSVDKKGIYNITKMLFFFWWVDGYVPAYLFNYHTLNSFVCHWKSNSLLAKGLVICSKCFGLSFFFICIHFTRDAVKSEVFRPGAMQSRLPFKPCDKLSDTLWGQSVSPIRCPRDTAWVVLIKQHSAAGLLAWTGRTPSSLLAIIHQPAS